MAKSLNDKFNAILQNKKIKPVEDARSIMHGFIEEGQKLSIEHSQSYTKLECSIFAVIALLESLLEETAREMIISY